MKSFRSMSVHKYHKIIFNSKPSRETNIIQIVIRPHCLVSLYFSVFLRYFYEPTAFIMSSLWETVSCGLNNCGIPWLLFLSAMEINIWRPGCSRPCQDFIEYRLLLFAQNIKAKRQFSRLPSPSGWIVYVCVWMSGPVVCSNGREEWVPFCFTISPECLTLAACVWTSIMYLAKMVSNNKANLTPYNMVIMGDTFKYYIQRMATSTGLVQGFKVWGITSHCFPHFCLNWSGKLVTVNFWNWNSTRLWVLPFIAARSV